MRLHPDQSQAVFTVSFYRKCHHFRHSLSLQQQPDDSADEIFTHLVSVMVALSGFNLSVSSFLSLTMSRLSIAGPPSLSRNFSCSPGIDFRAEFYFRLGAGPLNLAA
jgi:hypothetical protein